MTLSGHLYKVQVRNGDRFWQTKHAVPHKTEAESLYEAIMLSSGWRKRLMYQDRCLAQASS